MRPFLAMQVFSYTAYITLGSSLTTTTGGATITPLTTQHPDTKLKRQDSISDFETCGYISGIQGAHNHAAWDHEDELDSLTVYSLFSDMYSRSMQFFNMGPKSPNAIWWLWL